MICRLASLAGLLGVISCNVASVEQAPSAATRNQCASSAECGGGECDDMQCRSHAGELQHVLFEVTPPSDTTAGVQFLKELDLPSAGGGLDLDLDLVSEGTGQVVVVGRKCVPQFDLAVDKLGNTIPAVLTLSPSTTVLGLYSPRIVVQSKLVDDKYFGFSLYAAPGRYDIYVEANRQVDDSCPVPPALLRGQMIGNGFEVRLPEPSTFEFHVSWPGDGALDGWTVDMLDPVSGRVISNRAQLAFAKASKTDYVATLYYLPVVSNVPEQPASELLRLSPPDGVTAPSVVLARSALGIFTPNSGELRQLTSLPKSVRVRGQVTANATPTPAAATVTLVADKLDGIDPGVIASFVRTVSVPASGDFEVDLLPGSYLVSAVPVNELDVSGSSKSETELAAVSLRWEVAASPEVQAGKVIELGRALRVSGQAFSGSLPMTTAEARVSVSPASVRVNPLDQALGKVPFVPRVSSASIDVGGNYALYADPGTFDLSIRPAANTGFGWLVVPSVPVGVSDLTKAGVNLGRQQAPWPVAYRGSVTVPGAPERVPVSSALIRAYVYMSGGHYTSDRTKADSVIQVAETRADDSGVFEVLIPASLNAWDETLSP